MTDIVDLRSNAEYTLEGPGPLLSATPLTHHHHSLFRDDEPEVTAERRSSCPG